MMMAAALCAGLVSAKAQSSPSDHKQDMPATSKDQAGSQAHKDCLRTSDAEWKALGLSADQMTQVKAIQAEHEKACAAMKDDAGMKKEDPAKAQMADADEARIKEVLTPAQYDSWKKQCTAMATPAKPMDKK